MDLLLKDYTAYWYCCDGFNDTGFGCGWRCLQMLLAQLARRRFEANPRLPGSLFEIAVEMNDWRCADPSIKRISKSSREVLPFLDALWAARYFEQCAMRWRLSGVASSRV